jgi:cytochrome c oxidase accessory protein FixG
LTQPSLKPKLLGPWRTTCQWLCTLAILGIPFVRIDGHSLLRLDFPTLTLWAAGNPLPIESLPLLLLLTLVLVLFFLLVTLAFGRAWCGWGCPQTTLVDLFEWLARRSGVKVQGGTLSATRGQQLLLHLFALALALLVGANLCWYFVSPYDFFPGLLAGTLHWVTLLTLAVTAVTVYLDLAFLRRLICKEFCPYGRFQTVLVDPGTLTLRFHPDEAPRCIRCSACVRACPTGIDIRDGYQIECINCGRCLDACRQVMARRQQAGIIRYTFGLEGRGPGALLNPRVALVLAACLALTVTLAVMAGQRQAMTLALARNPQLLPRETGDGQVANFFSAYLANHAATPGTVRLRLHNADGVELRGLVEAIPLAANEKRRIDFALLAAAGRLTSPLPVTLQLVDGNGQVQGVAEIYLTGVMPTPGGRTP